MRMLHKAVGDLPILAICTHACKELEKAAKAEFPQAEQRKCFRHLMQNKGFVQLQGSSHLKGSRPTECDFQINLCIFEPWVVS